MSRVNVVHADTYRDLVCSCRATMRVHACENEVIIELYRSWFAFTVQLGWMK